MKFKTFEEYKDFDAEYSDLAKEYAKLIISTYIDKKDEDYTLEYVFADIIEGDELHEDQEIMIKESLTDYLENLLEESKKIRDVDEIQSDRNEKKFNI